MNLIDRFATALMDRYRIIRVSQIASATTLMWIVQYWAMNFAMTSTRPGLEVAAIIAAVVAPATTYAGWVFSAYVTSRKGDQ